MLYNKILRRQLKSECASCESRVSSRLHWLEFLGALVKAAPAGQAVNPAVATATAAASQSSSLYALNPELALDGTHLSPRYVAHLDTALSNLGLGQ